MEGDIFSLTRKSDGVVVGSYIVDKDGWLVPLNPDVTLERTSYIMELIYEDTENLVSETI